MIENAFGLLRKKLARIFMHKLPLIVFVYSILHKFCQHYDEKSNLNVDHHMSLNRQRYMH